LGAAARALTATWRMALTAACGGGGAPRGVRAVAGVSGSGSGGGCVSGAGCAAAA
jgi:hypothetical protein